MDFIKLVSATQKEKGLTDKEIAERTGINEYTYYNLKKYRLYLSKVAYFSLSCVLDLPILSDKEINSILVENQGIVGIPETNLDIAAEYVNPKQVERLEKELSRVKDSLDKMDAKNSVINAQFLEIEKLKKDLSSEWKDLNLKIQEAYSKGVKDGANKVEIMKSSASQHLIDIMNEEYTDKINKLEKALSKVENQYMRLYKVVQFFNINNPEYALDLSIFEKPLALQKEELGLIVSDDMKVQILNSYHNLGMSIEEIEKEVVLNRKQIEDIILHYNIRKNKGRLEVYTLG